MFPRTDVASAERMRDGRIDGAVKGAIFGAVLGLITAQAYDSGSERFAAWAGSAALYGGIGYALDAAQTHRSRSIGRRGGRSEVSYRFASEPGAASTLDVRQGGS